MTWTATPDASEGLAACVDLVATLEAPETSPTSPTLEGAAALETFMPKQRRWLTAEATAPTNQHPAFVVSRSGSCSSREVATGLRWRLQETTNSRIRLASCQDIDD
jgi:hypothetical protein